MNVGVPGTGLSYRAPLAQASPQASADGDAASQNPLFVEKARQLEQARAALAQLESEMPDNPPPEMIAERDAARDLLMNADTAMLQARDRLNKQFNDQKRQRDRFITAFFVGAAMGLWLLFGLPFYMH